MSKDDIFGEIVDLFKRKSNLDWKALRCDEKPMRFYGVDSLVLIKIVSGLEERFGVRIRDEEMVETGNFAKLVSLVESKLELSGADNLAR